MRPSRRELIEQKQLLADQYERVTADRDEHAKDSSALASTLLRVSYELSRAKDIVAAHINAAGHPATVLHTPQEFAEALRMALQDAGVDIRIELARLEGAEL